MTTKAERLEDSWKDLRPGYIRSDWQPPPRSVLQRWVSSLGEGGDCVLTVEGPTTAHRTEVYRQVTALSVVTAPLDNWVDGVVDSVVTRPPIWRMLQDVVRLEEFVIDEPLRSTLDRGGLLTEVFQALWEIRFLFDEGSVVEPFVRYLTDWIVDPKPPGPILRTINIKRPLPRHQRLEMFFFLLTLAKQNGNLDRAVLTIDGLETLVELPSKTRRARLRELSKLTSTAKKWAALGSPLGLLIGYSKKRSGGLELELV
jgi:hypothetical protein